ncbi:MAG: MFS transporter [Desulfotalea sp.]|nr:MAG: MFS transporter [Desulfotalea sp.]
MQKLKKDPMYRYLLVLTLCATGGLLAWRTLFDNFAVQAIGLDGYHIGVIQSLREVPGFLALLVVYVLLFVKEHKIAAFSILLLGLGVCLTGFFPSFYGLIATTMLMSFGFHYFETMNQSLTMQYFDKSNSPIIFGLLRGRAAACNVVVALFFLAFADSFSFKTMYLSFGIPIIIVACFALLKNPSRENIPLQHKNIIYRKKYWLFYLLTLLAGARRQVFVAFAVFLLVKKFDYTISEIAALFLLNNIINYFLSPFIGRCIAKFGEHKVLSLEYSALIIVFIGYALVQDKYLAGLLYIFDHIFFNFAIAIKTFFQKIADPKDIAPSMAVGFTINHIAAVLLPMIGGLLWLIDYKIPFFAGAFLSVISLWAVQFIPAQLKKNVPPDN